MTPEQRQANKKRDQTKNEWDKTINTQYIGYGGWCAYCGEACKPFYKNLPQEFIDTACEYNGEHPDCGKEHVMKLVEVTPDTFGGYEIYKCMNDDCDWTETA